MRRDDQKLIARLCDLLHASANADHADTLREHLKHTLGFVERFHYVSARDARRLRELQREDVKTTEKGA